MSIVQRHLQNLRFLEENIDDFATEIVRENSELILLVLQEKQLGIGQYFNGNPLKWSDGDGYYSPNTQEVAERENAVMDKPSGQPYNFQWSGTTFSTMILESSSSDSTFSIFSRDGKEALLKGIYGDKLFKLSNENNKFVNETIIEPKLVIFIEEHWWQSIT